MVCNVPLFLFLLFIFYYIQDFSWSANVTKYIGIIGNININRYIRRHIQDMHLLSIVYISEDKRSSLKKEDVYYPMYLLI